MKGKWFQIKQIFFRKIKAVRVIQQAWRKYFAVRREEKMKVKYQS